MSTGLTPNYSLSYPLSTDPVNVASDVEDLAKDLDTFLTNPSFINNINVNLGSISTSATTANLFNINATTLNVGLAATALSMGATTGTATIRNPTIVSAATSLTLFNTTSTTINFGAAATTFNIGASAGAATMNISNGATTNATTKTVNIGGSGVSGSTTNINIGSAVSGALGTTTINSATVSIPSVAISLGTVTSGTWSGTAIAVNKGGTGLTSYAIGDIVYASGATTLAKLSDVATGNALISGGVGVAPSWGKIALTTHVSGTLPVANGGTGVTTSTGTGNVVLSSSPSLITPSLGVATGTSFNSITGLSSTTPVMNGIAAVGTAATVARADHVHASDTSRAPLASPTFTGTPAAPTAAANTNTTQLATTAFVTAADNLKANLASPTFTGVPLSTTAAADTNTTQIATTAFIIGQAGASAPLVNGTAAVGTSLRYSRQDHVHGTDTTRAALASPTFTGTVTLATTTEVLNTGTISTGVFTANFSTGGVFYITTAPTANFTVNVTNLPTTDNRVTIVSFFVIQGATGYIPNALQIGGSVQTIKWSGGSAPTPTNGAGKVDVFTFTFIRRGAAWEAIGTSNRNF